MSAARPLYATTPRIHRGSDLRSLLRILTVLAMVGALLFVAPVAASADEDVSPPELAEFSFAPTSVDTSSGSADVTFTFDVTDDLSGLDYGGI